jgi:hypothetical protein
MICFFVGGPEGYAFYLYKKMVELQQVLNRNFRRAVCWSVANACYLVWLFRFIKHFISPYFIIYARSFIYFYLLQHISDYSIIPPTLDTEIIVVRRKIRKSDAGEVLFCYGFKSVVLFYRSDFLIYFFGLFSGIKRI